ncbi:MAG: helix-turn-helix transcriptional regulator [Erythrobacter sp.]|nr:helix-turn-helix transcriptional regulator [Erythrobacter sp.]
MVTVESKNGPIELTQKQHEVLCLAARHLNTKEIAREMSLSPRTVQDHLDAARRKLGAATRGEAIQAIGYAPSRDTRAAKRITPDDPSASSTPLSEETYTFRDAGFADPSVQGGGQFRQKPEWVFRGFSKTALLVFGLAAAIMVLINSGLDTIDVLIDRLADN